MDAFRTGSPGSPAISEPMSLVIGHVMATEMVRYAKKAASPPGPSREEPRARTEAPVTAAIVAELAQPRTWRQPARRRGRRCGGPDEQRPRDVLRVAREGRATLSRGDRGRRRTRHDHLHRGRKIRPD